MYAKAVVLFICACAVPCLSTDNRIVGGRPAEAGEFPYQVSLRRSYNDNHFCGGSLITASHVLTAAHCMYYVWGGILPPIVVRVVAGQLNLTLTENSVQRNVSKITIHPHYDKVKMFNDVAIIELSEPFDVIDNMLIATVPLRAKELLEGSCIASGWGVEDHASKNVSEILLAAEVDIINRKRCNELYEGAIGDSMICAGLDSGERDTCQGDSGGPLLCNGLLTGVISTGMGCADAKYPGVYANVAHLLSWILENSREEVEEPVSEAIIMDNIVEEPTKTIIVEGRFETEEEVQGRANGNIRLQSGIFVITIGIFMTFKF